MVSRDAERMRSCWREVSWASADVNFPGYWGFCGYDLLLYLILFLWLFCS